MLFQKGIPNAPKPARGYNNLSKESKDFLKKDEAKKLEQILLSLKKKRPMRLS